MGALFMIIIVLFFLISFVGSLISITNKRVRNDEKLIWLLFVIFMPIIGSFIYLIAGRPRLIAFQIKNSNRQYFKY